MLRTSTHHRILIVARRSQIDSLSGVLEHPAWICDFVPTPADALGALRRQQVDLLVIRVEPDQVAACVELIRSLKLDNRWAHVLILCLLASGCDERRIDLYAAGADDCISSFVAAEEGHIRVQHALRMQRAMESLEDADRIIQSLAIAVEGKDHCTCGHVDRVSVYCVEMGRRLGLPHEELKLLKIGGAVHDIGKIAISDTILNKPGALTDEEFAIMRTHPVIGYDLLKPLRTFQNILPMVRWHHEKPNGGGYPDGLKGEQIPLHAKIVAVADVFDALSSDRPYRAAIPLLRCIAILRDSGAKGQLDPDLVNLLSDILGQNNEVAAA